MTNPKVSVIVVNWNGLQHLAVNLTSLMNQDYSNFEIIFVDNGSTDSSVAYVRKNFPSVIVIESKNNLGFSGGNNLGIRASVGEIVALVNNDTEVTPSWLEECVRAMEQHPEAGFIASSLCLFNDHKRIDTCGDLYFRSGYPGKRGWLESCNANYTQSDWVFGACAGAAVYKREMLDLAGLFDEDYFCYQEDVDLSFRGQLLGFRCLYVPQAVVYHKVGATAGRESPQKLYWSHRNHWYTIIKDLPTTLIFRYLISIIFADFVVGLSAMRKGQLGVFITSRLDVIQNLKSLLRKRRAIQKSRKISNSYLHSIISGNWFLHRKEEKVREKNYFSVTGKA